MDDVIRVAEYQIDRGRSYELDRVDTGRASVLLHDVEGVLDPTNSGGPFAGEIQPLLQVRLALWNPVLEDWYTRFRGFVESFQYEFDPSQRVNRVTMNLVDLFEIVSAIQMFPGFFGDPLPSGTAGDPFRGNVYYAPTLAGDVHGMQNRINNVLRTGDLGNCRIPPEFAVVLSGNVSLQHATYASGESAMTVIQDAVEAEMPSVGNVFVDRLGRLNALGRYARFDPEGTSAATAWDFHDWKAGDGAAVNAHPATMAHIRAFSTSRDLGKIINRALAVPRTTLEGNEYENRLTDAVIESAPSIEKYGIRPWSAEDLLTREGVTDGLTGSGPPTNSSWEDAKWDETKRFAAYYVSNYHTAENRVTEITFRSQKLTAIGAAPNWALLSEVEISDRVTISIGSPGGGGFAAKEFFVEGVHETYRPLNDEMDDVTLSLDVSPADYFSDSPFA